MVGSQQYKNIEIHYVLKAIHMRMPPDWVRMRFEQRFKRKLTENQLRYLKNKYGRDPRFGTPAANSTSTFGAPNPRIGPGYWPTDSILAINYQAFEERGDDVAEPNLRVVAPINGIVAPTPSPVAPHAPVAPSGGPDGPELAGALSTHTTSLTGQKRAHGTGPEEEEEVDGLTENRLPNLHKISRINASAGYTNNSAQSKYSAAFHSPSPIYANGTVLSGDGGLAPTPVAVPLPLPQPPAFCFSSPVHTYAFGQANQLQMNSFPITQLSSMGQGVASNMYTGALSFQEDAYAHVSGVARHRIRDHINTVPFCHPNANFSFNAGFGQHVSNDVCLPGHSHQHGPKGVLNHSLDQSSTLSNPWEFNSSMFHTSMNLLNSTPGFIGPNNTPAIGTQNYPAHDRLANHSPFWTASNMAPPVTSFQPINSQFSQQISPDGAAVPEPDACDRLGTELNKDVLDDNATSKEYREQMHREFIESLSVCGTGANSPDFFSRFPPAPGGIFNQALGIADSAANVNASTGKAASSDEVYETDISDRDCPTTASTISTRGTSVSQMSDSVHKGKVLNENWLEIEHPTDSFTPSAAQSVLGYLGGLEQK